MQQDWPHQVSAFDQVEAAIAQGQRRICLAMATGAGKTRVASKLINAWSDQEHRTVIYTNRRMLVDQLSANLDAAGIDHGVRASGWSTDNAVFPVQIASIQTEDARVNKAKTWQLHDAKRILVDESHCNKGPVAKGIIDRHVSEGAAIVGLTATPLDIGDIYHHLIQAGTMAELRACGALVPAWHYAPSEPDLRQFGKAARAKLAQGQDLSEADQRQAFTNPGIFGCVIEWYHKLNPNQKPTILFASGVPESIWFAEQFTKAGVPAAHIDGDVVYWNGEAKRSSSTSRAELKEAFKEGDVKVVCNRFVLREGIDWPFIEHMIFATVFGSLQSFLQSGGRGMRACEDKQHLIVQDHGGLWWRFGSLNADREWRLDYTAAIAAGLREERFRQGKEREPFRCPECGMVLSFLKCKCGYVVKPGMKPPRMVMQSNGDLKPMHGDIFKPRRICRASNGASNWKRMYFRSCTEKGARTFRAAMALFAMENNYGYPDPSWPYMPIEPMDWFRNVADVPRERLQGYANNNVQELRQGDLLREDSFG